RHVSGGVQRARPDHFVSVDRTHIAGPRAVATIEPAQDPLSLEIDRNLAQRRRQPFAAERAKDEPGPGSDHDGVSGIRTYVVRLNLPRIPEWRSPSAWSLESA